jgi:putative transposon-encoded protein
MVQMATIKIKVLTDVTDFEDWQSRGVTAIGNNGLLYSTYIGKKEVDIKKGDFLLLKNANITMKTQALDEPKQVLKIGEKTKVRRISHAF